MENSEKFFSSAAAAQTAMLVNLLGVYEGLLKRLISFTEKVFYFSLKYTKSGAAAESLLNFLFKIYTHIPTSVWVYVSQYILKKFAPQIRSAEKLLAEQIDFDLQKLEYELGKRKAAFAARVAAEAFAEANAPAKTGEEANAPAKTGEEA